MKTGRLSIFSILFLFLIAGFSCSIPGKSQPKAIGGKIDLRQIDFQATDSIDLAGQWEFFPGVFLEPGDPDLPESLNKSNLIAVPGIWGNHLHNGKKIGPDGFATYRLKILLPDQSSGSEFALRIKDLNTAYRIFINGNEII